jgi:hypothetical protein
MNRRDFIKRLLTGVGVTVAVAAGIVDAASALTIDKYTRALQLHDKVVNNPTSIQAQNKFVEFVSSDLFPVANSKQELIEASRLFGNERNADGKLVGDYDLKAYQQSVMTTIPPVVADATFAIALMRSVLAKHRVPLEPSKIPSWETFSLKYQDLILRA